MQNKISKIIYSFSIKQKIIFILLIIVIFFNIYILLFKISNKHSIEIPIEGGKIVEGVIGTPRFISPIYAQSNVDKDISSLIYSGLMRKTGKNNFIPDLAEGYTLSDDKMIYTFIIRDTAKFHDGEKVRAEDIVFTIETIQDHAVNSPYRQNWEGIFVEEIDHRTVSFKLNQLYPDFIFNTTIGILPKHIWEGIQPEQLSFSDYNIKPIGSGPYKFSNFEKNNKGIPVKYSFSANKNFIIKKPFIEKIIFKFFNNEDDLKEAFSKKEIDNIHAISTSEENKEFFEENKEKIITQTLPRVYGIFFNKNKNKILRDKNIIKVIELLIDKENLIKTVMLSYGRKVNSLLIENEENLFNKEEAEKLLVSDGWERNEETKIFEKEIAGKITQLSFSIATSNVPGLKQTAEIIERDLENGGFNITVKNFDTGNLNQDIIRPREYEALLFGQAIEKPSDLYAFWHSSQKSDPGLNVSLYINKNVDTYLENLRKEDDKEKINEIIKKIDENFKIDCPAIFLYSPELIYIISNSINNINIEGIKNTSERFNNVYEWYIKTNQVWKFLIKDKNQLLL